jgi:hypothetical protein
MTKPLYFYNGTTFEQVGPTTPQSPIAYQTSAPTGPATGDIWIDSDGDVDTYNRQLTRYYFVATAAQTTITGTDANGLTLAYVAGSEAVYVNGALQVRGQDYTATNGTSVVLSSALAVNDVVEIFAYTAFTVANAYTKAEVDSIVTALGGTTTPWTSYTPTITSITLGNGTLVGKYKQIGKTVDIYVKLTFGSTTSFSGSNPSFTLPVNNADSTGQVLTAAGVRDADGALYPAIILISQTLFNCYTLANGSFLPYGAMNSTSPMTWTTSDYLTVKFTYEAA